MIPELVHTTSSLETMLLHERPRLVHLCARLTGDAHAAEDLAQETLWEAWKNAHKLYDPTGSAQWLSAIARNMCLRWARSQGRERARLVQMAQRDDEPVLQPQDLVEDTFDFEVELERHELAELLDRALALLPEATRAVLVERYVNESPLAEVAAQLGVSEAAVAMRLQRGKLLLRRVLVTDLQAEAAAYGLGARDADRFAETSIWCPVCGQSRLRGRFEAGTRQLTLQCPTCIPEPGTSMICGGDAALFDGIQGYKPAVRRLAAWANDYFQRGTIEGVVPCLRCGRSVPLLIRVDEDVHLPAIKHHAWIECRTCHETCDSALLGFALGRPEGQRFWKEHPRMRALPEREVEAAGQPAVVTSFESLSGAARLDVVFTADTFRVLSIHGAPHA